MPASMPVGHSYSISSCLSAVVPLTALAPFICLLYACHSSRDLFAKMLRRGVLILCTIALCFSIAGTMRTPESQTGITGISFKSSLMLSPLHVLLYELFFSAIRSALSLIIQCIGCHFQTHPPQAAMKASICWFHQHNLQISLKICPISSLDWQSRYSHWLKVILRLASIKKHDFFYFQRLTFVNYYD